MIKINTTNVLIFLLSITILYFTYKIYDNKIGEYHINEKFSNNNKFTQKYNLLSYSAKENTDADPISLDIVLNKPSFIKQIYLKSEKAIPLDLQILVNNNQNNSEKYIDMSSYKVFEINDESLFYDSKELKLDNIVDNNNNIIQGDNIKLYSKTYNIEFTEIIIYGNETGRNYKFLSGEQQLYSASTTNNNIINYDAETFKPNEKCIVSKIDFTEFINSLSTSTTPITTTPVTINITNNYLTKNMSFLIHINAPFVVFEKPVLVDNYFSVTQNSKSIENIVIHGKIALPIDIQNYKFDNNIILTDDVLNLDDITGTAKELEYKNNTNLMVLDVLNYQDKINRELKELNLNKYNIRKMKNKQIEIDNIKMKIDNITDKYLSLMKASDDYNSDKLFETINNINMLKNELDSKETTPTEAIDLNIVI